MRIRNVCVLLLLKVIIYSSSCVHHENNIIMESTECKVHKSYMHITNFFHEKRLLFWDNIDKNTNRNHDCLKTGLLRQLFERRNIKFIHGTDIKEVISNEYSEENSLIISKQGLIIIEQALNNFEDISWLKILSHHSKSSVAFVMTYGRKSQVECSESDFRADEMNIILENFFYELWTRMRILKVVAALPYFCGDVTFITYDHEAWIASDGEYGRGIRFHTHEDIKRNPDRLLVEQLSGGFPLRISIFERMPTSPHLSTTYVPYLQNIIDKTNGYGGLDGFIMAEAVRHFNYTPDIHVAEGYEQYGYFMENGTAVGSLGDVVNGVVDVSFNSRFIKEYGPKGYTFLHWIYIDSLCIVVDKAGEIPQWLGLLHFCTWEVSLMGLVVPVAVSVMRWMFRQKLRKKRRPLLSLMLDTQVTTIFQGFVSRIIPEERFIIGLCLFLNLIVSSIYQGNVKATFTTKKYFPDVNTLEELDEGGYIIGTSPGLHDIFGYRTGDTFKSLNKKLFVYSNSTPVRDVLQGRKAATINRESDANIMLMFDESGPGGEPLLHMVPDCPRNFFLGYIVGNTFPFSEQMDRFVTRMVEAGLPTWYYEFTKHVLVINSRARTFSYTRDAEPLDMKIVRAAFFILSVGIGISTIILLIEIGWIFRRRAKFNTSWDMK